MASETQHCSICGVCFCVPSDTLLLSYQDISSQYKPIVDDDVLWLGHFRLLGRNPIVPQKSPEVAKEDDEFADPPEKYFLSGPGRFRRSKAEFLRGSIIGTHWRADCSVKGEGAAEVLAMPIRDLSGFLTLGHWRERILLVHGDCYGTILPRAMDYIQRENRHWRHLPMKSLKVSLDDMHPKLIVSGDMVESNRCGPGKFSPWEDEGPAAGQRSRDWIQAKRVWVFFHAEST